MLNFSSEPKIIKEIIEKKSQELNLLVFLVKAKKVLVKAIFSLRNGYFRFQCSSCLCKGYFNCV